VTGSKILVVEDDALIADDIQRTLIRLGYEVPLTVATGLEAIEAAGSMRPQLMLMDIKLQGTMDGIEAAIVIRRQFEIPVVYLTSHSDEATLDRAMQTAPSGYLLKPFSDRELRTAIEVALHKHALEARLAERERWLSTTLRSIGDGVIATDRVDNVAFMNAVAEKLTGWTEADAVGRPLAEIFHLVTPTGERVARPVLPVYPDDAAPELPSQLALVTRAGGRIAVDDSTSSIIDAKGNVLGGVAVFRDVTERHELEQRVTQSERLAALGTLAAGMGHEINNPLTTVVANLSFATGAVQVAKARVAALSSDRESSVHDVVEQLAEVASALADAELAADRMRQIVSDLGRLNYRESGVRILLPLSEVLDSSVKMMALTVRRHARLVKAYGITPFVEANEGQLTQVFTHLLVNAAHALGAESDEPHEIRIVTYTDALGRAVVEVCDDGPGIDAEMLRKIFDPFFTTKSFGAGVGLGLAVSHNIITALGGEIVVESKPGHGAVFRVALPAARVRSLRPAIGPTAPAVSRRGHLLIIDDEASVGGALQRILHKQHDVTVVTRGENALAKVASESLFDVIFCDMMMPSMSGIEIYKQIAAVNPEQARRMVFMTGGAFMPLADEFLASTGNIIIKKPFATATVLAIVKDYTVNAAGLFSSRACVPAGLDTHPAKTTRAKS
jgi:two-component system cell cycle sensor histidine kinase/response regulator CckA